ncbi:MAG: hypothetical protein M1444_02485 [Patescibacteria group bacterium]|nr:hypothetical protein [Patescibacteria group bacterium]
MSEISGTRKARSRTLRGSEIVPVSSNRRSLALANRFVALTKRVKSS